MYLEEKTDLTTMRLANPSTGTRTPAPAVESSGGGSIVNADLVDQTMSASDRRRSRDAGANDAASATATGSSTGSSLDYKADPNMKHLLTTPGVPRKENKRLLEQQKLEQQQLQQQQAMRRGPTFTRARGSGGTPPRKFDLSDLEHLSEEDLMQVLYNNPELAEVAAAQSAKQQRSASGSARSNRKRSKGRSNTHSEYPAHLQERMDDGVPVFQWVVLLALLGIGLYQLRKMLILSPPSSKSKKQSSKLYKQTKNAKRKNKPPIKTNNMATHSTTDGPEKKESSSPPDEVKVETTKVDVATSSSTSKKKNKKWKPSGTVETNKGKEKEMGISTTPAASHDNKISESTPLAREPSGPNPADESSPSNDASRWQPVAKKTPKQENGISVGGSNASAGTTHPLAPESQPYPASTTATNDNTTPVTEAIADGNGFQVAARKKKKKKNSDITTSSLVAPKLPKQNGSSHNAPVVTSNEAIIPTDPDAALALQLQQEEQKAIHPQLQPTLEEEWAEVPKKAKKGKR